MAPMIPTSWYSLLSNPLSLNVAWPSDLLLTEKMAEVMSYHSVIRLQEMITTVF